LVGFGFIDFTGDFLLAGVAGFDFELVASFLETEPFLDVVEKKAFKILSIGDKRVYLRGSKVFMGVHKPEFGAGFKEMSEQEAKQKHYGRTRSVGTVANIEELKQVLELYFK
jgi:hypothetical protein